MNKTRRHWLFNLLGTLTLAVFIIPGMAKTASAAPTRIACVGDSITYGAGVPDNWHKAWPGVLQQLLGDRYKVGNFGHSGATLLKHGDLPYWRVAEFKKSNAFKANIVIIMLGTNDTKPQNWKYAREFPKDLKAMILHYENLVTKPRVILCTPPPVLHTNYGINAKNLAAVIPDIKKVARAMHIPVIRIHHFMSVDPNVKQLLQNDGIHPNASGQAFMAHCVYAWAKHHG